MLVRTHMNGENYLVDFLSSAPAAWDAQVMTIVRQLVSLQLGTVIKISSLRSSLQHLSSCNCHEVKIV